MTTLVELSEQELTELKTFTNQTEDSAAVRLAMTEYLRFARRMQLKALSGLVEISGNWQELEDLEKRECNGGADAGAD